MVKNFEAESEPVENPWVIVSSNHKFGNKAVSQIERLLMSLKSGPLCALKFAIKKIINFLLPPVHRCYQTEQKYRVVSTPSSGDVLIRGQMLVAELCLLSPQFLWCLQIHPQNCLSKSWKWSKFIFQNFIDPKKSWVPYFQTSSSILILKRHKFVKKCTLSKHSWKRISNKFHENFFSIKNILSIK